MFARIYRPTKTATQSGRAHADQWILEFEPAAARRLDPLMGWTGSADTQGQVRLRFDSSDAAVAYARQHRIPHQVISAPPQTRILKAYADNFATARREPWTH